MRFVSQYRRPGIQVRPVREMVLATGETQRLVEPLYIKFWQGDLSEREVRAAEEYWGAFAGRTVERDGVTPTPLSQRLSVFDTEIAQDQLSWDDETRQMVEELLLQKVGSSYIHVPAEKILPPWPAYDSFTGDLNDLLAKLVEDGHPLAAVLLYESTDGLKRPAVIAFLTEEIERAEREEAAGEFVRA